MVPRTIVIIAAQLTSLPWRVCRSQIRNALKTKAFEFLQTQGGGKPRARPAERPKHQQQQANMVTKSDVTLNMLNAGVPEHEVDMGAAYYDGPTEEVS